MKRLLLAYALAWVAIFCGIGTIVVASAGGEWQPMAGIGCGVLIFGVGLGKTVKD